MSIIECFFCGNFTMHETAGKDICIHCTADQSISDQKKNEALDFLALLDDGREDQARHYFEDVLLDTEV